MPPKLIPAMADTGEIVAFARTHPGPESRRAGAQPEGLPARARSRRAQGHLPRLGEPQAQRVQRAHDAGADGRGSAQVRAATRIPASRSKARCRPRSAARMQGDVPEDDVVRIAAALAEFCDCVALADTVGYANPAQIKRLFSKVKRRDRQQARSRASAQHPRPRPRQRARRLRGRRAPLRQLARRARRLPVRARRERQRDHRGPGVHVRGDGRENRHRPATS